MKRLSVIVTATFLGFILASPARADSYVAPSIGVNFGGDAGHPILDATSDTSKLSWGVAAGTMFGGIVGVEEDFTYGPSFYGSGGGVDTHVITLMTNMIIGIPIGGQKGSGFRPYGTVGLGLINRDLDVNTPLASSNFSSNDFGFDLGAGVMGYFANHIGVRAGVQYFRNFESTDNNGVGIDFGHFNFYRGSFGVLFRF